MTTKKGPGGLDNTILEQPDFIGMRVNTGRFVPSVLPDWPLGSKFELNVVLAANSWGEVISSFFNHILSVYVINTIFTFSFCITLGVGI